VGKVHRFLPLEVIVVAEMASRGCLAVNWSSELESLNDHTHPQVEVTENDLAQLVVTDNAGAIAIDEYRDGLRNADPVGKLDHAPLA
jgi:hypothetical protein